MMLAEGGGEPTGDRRLATGDWRLATRTNRERGSSVYAPMALIQDLKYACRMLVKDPGLSAVAVLALALGIGMNTTVFTCVNAVLIRGLPFADSHELLHLDLINRATRNEFPASWLEFDEWRQRTKTFSALAAFRSSSMNVTETSRPPERV